MFTDDYFKFGYVNLMYKTFGALEKFIEFKVESKNQLGKHIKALWFERGGEYMSTSFNFFLKGHEILSQLSAPRTPQQNWEVERKNRTLMNMVRYMMNFSSLPLSF